jgi:hypothetical protein
VDEEPLTPAKVAPRNAPAHGAGSASGDGDAVVRQVRARVLVAFGAMEPQLRMINTLLTEYARALRAKQLAMTQSAGAKLEAKGNELQGKITEFEGLSRSPLFAGGGGEVQAFARRLQEVAEGEDLAAIRQVATLAVEFRKNPDAANDLAAHIPEAEAAMRRLKQG